MSNFKMTMVFQQDDQGWTESYYSGSTGTDPSTLVSKAWALAVKRIALCGRETGMTYLRISNIDVKRTTYLHRLTPELRGTAGYVSDSPNTCLVLAMKDTTLAKSKTTFLRGIADEMVDNGGGYAPTPAYRTLLTAFINVLINASWGWLGIATNTDADLQTLVQNANGTVSGTVIPTIFAPNLNGLTRVLRFKGLTQPGNLNGANPCIITGIGSFETAKRIAILPWANGGKVVLATKTLYPIAEVLPQYIGERKAGKIFASARGRAPARKRA